MDYPVPSPPDPVGHVKVDWIDEGEGCKRPAGWYFWDETWSSAYGPFETEDDCRDALLIYSSTLR